DSDLRQLVVQGAAAAGQTGCRGRGELSLSRGKHSHFPGSGGFGRHDARGRIGTCACPQPLRGNRRDSFRVAALSLAGRRVLLIISGGIAAYKALELVRLLRGQGSGVTCVLTENGGRFVTPLSLQALSESKVYVDLFSLTDESEMGHIQLSRSADLLVVAPATANILAKMAAGLADDLASTVLLATDKPVLVAPAMNLR